MGRDKTFKYAIEIKDSTGIWTRMAWEYGPANEKNLKQFIYCLNASMKPGGPNAHLADSGPHFSYTAGRIVENRSDGAEVAAWAQPMFEVL